MTDAYLVGLTLHHKGRLAALYRGVQALPLPKNPLATEDRSHRLAPQMSGPQSRIRERFFLSRPHPRPGFLAPNHLSRAATRVFSADPD